MNDSLLLVLVILVVAVAIIEFLPRRYDVIWKVVIALLLIEAGLWLLPHWFGWTLVAAGIAAIAWAIRFINREFGPGPMRFLRGSLRNLVAWSRVSLAWLARSIVAAGKRLGSFIQSILDGRRQKILAPDAPSRVRVWMGTVAILVASPVSAIPSTIVLVSLLTVVDLFRGDMTASDPGVAGTLKQMAGYTLVIVLVSLDVIARKFLITLPILAVSAYAGSSVAARCEPRWKRLAIASLLVGTLLPALYVVAQSFDWLDGPYFN